MSANYSDPVPGSSTGELLKPEEAQVQPGSIFANENMQINPQQSFREYTSPRAWTAPPVTPQPTYPTMPPQPATPQPLYPSNGSYQPGYPGQVPGGWQPSGSMPPPATPYPGHAPYPNYPGYPGNGAYPAYPGYNAYPGYSAYPAYPGYGRYPWPVMPAPPKRDSYLFAVAITAFVCSCLTILGGLGCVAFIGLIGLGQSLSHTPMSGSTLFAGILFFLTLAFAGTIGGGFSAYHSIRALFLRKPSKQLWLPRFWIFLLCYLATLGVGLWLHTQGWDVASLPLTALLVYLSGIFPALTILALGIRRLSFPKMWPGGRLGRGAREPRTATWPTTWRRLVLAMVSGATLSIGLALALELLFELILIGSQGISIFQSLSPNFGTSPSQYGILLITAAIVAPLVEEMVKPLAVVILIGRVKSKAEAFALGLACGIGFNLVETSGYISQGYGDWLNVALGRSGAGLLHGFGAAMVALGWYILTHREEGVWQKRTLLALGCMGYAILQHAIWNGAIGLVLLPGPIGTFFQTWNWSAGPFSLDGPELVNIAELIGMLIFFIYMVGRLRARTVAPALPEQSVQPMAGTYTAPA